PRFRAAGSIVPAPPAPAGRSSRDVDRWSACFPVVTASTSLRPGPIAANTAGTTPAGRQRAAQFHNPGRHGFRSWQASLLTRAHAKAQRRKDAKENKVSFLAPLRLCVRSLLNTEAKARKSYNVRRGFPAARAWNRF